MPEDFEQRITQALADAGGPVELAPQLVALANQFQVSTPKLNWHEQLGDWIRFHRGEQWSAGEFLLWAGRLIDAQEKLEEFQNGK